MRSLILHACITCALLLLSSKSVSAQETLHSIMGKVLWPGMLIELSCVHSALPIQHLIYL